VPIRLPFETVNRLHMVPLATELSPFEARVLAARLGAEGVVWELRGGSAVYPVGWVDVLVSVDDLADAQELLLADEVEAAFGDDPTGLEVDHDEPTATFRRRGHVVLVTIGVIVMLSFLTIRFWI
jgi:hypothetical protein